MSQSEIKVKTLTEKMNALTQSFLSIVGIDKNDEQTSINSKVIELPTTTDTVTEIITQIDYFDKVANVVKIIFISLTTHKMERHYITVKYNPELPSNKDLFEAEYAFLEAIKTTFDDELEYVCEISVEPYTPHGIAIDSKEADTYRQFAS